MADYAKKTVAELHEILKSRSLPTSGKKAELIARLNENDQEASAPEITTTAEEPEPQPIAEVAEPNISTITDAASAPATEAIQATQPIQPTVDPTSTATDNPSPDTALANQTTYSLHLPTSTLDSELAKRKARAERFGTSAAATASEPASAGANGDASKLQTSEGDTNGLKNMERAKRFGTGETAMGKLDEALPSELARGKKRGHGAVAEATDLDDPGLKRSFANRGRGGGGGGRFRNRGGRGGGGAGPGAGPAAQAARPAAQAARPQGIQKNAGGKPAPAYTSDKDKMAAEARKKKFSTA